MNFKTTILLLVVLAALGAYLLVSSNTPKTDVATQTDPAKLFTLKSADVTKVLLTPRDGKPTVVEKSGTDWKLTQPVAWPADTYAVSQFLDDLTSLSSRGQVEGASETSGGLDKPAFTIELTGAGGASQTVLVGNLSTLGSDLYVRRSSEKSVLLAPGSFQEKLDDVAKRLRDPKLVATSPADVKQVWIDRPGQPRVKLVKTGTTWNVTEPFNAPADAPAVTDLLAAVTGLRASEFVSETSSDLPRYGLDNPQASVRIETTEPTTQPSAAVFTGTIVQIGRYDDVRKQNVFATTGSAVAKVPIRLLELAEKPAVELRSKEVVKIDPAKVSKFTVSIDVPATTQPTTLPSDVRSVQVRRRVETVVFGPQALPATTQASTLPTTNPVQTTWQVKSANDTWTDANDAAVDELLKLFDPLRAQKFLPSVPVLPTLSAGHFKLNVTTEEGGKSTTHAFAITEGLDGKNATVEYDGVVFEMDSTLVQKLKSPLK